jgi:hypothetical protein
MTLSVLKKLGIATAVLLAVWLLYLYRQVPHEQSPFEKACAKAERIILEQGPQKVELRKESGPPEARLAKGGHWEVGSGPSYAADESSVATLISGLKGILIDDEISDRADRAAEYEVNLESGTVVRLLDGKGTQLAEGIIGKQAPDFSHIYFRYPEKPNVYLARGLFRGDLGHVEVNYWRSRQLINIPETKIQSILIEGKGFKSELVRVSTDAWTLNGKAIDPTPVNSLVGTLAHLRADDFVDSAAFPALTYDSLTYAGVMIKGADASADLRIGAQDSKSKRYPVSVGRDQGLAWLSESSVNAILLKPSAFKEKK